MNISNEQLLEAFGSMTVTQLSDLTKALEERFGVKASQAVTAPTQPAQTPSPAAEEKTEFSVVLMDIGLTRVQVIKVLREATGLSLMDANKATAVGSVVKEGIAKEEAEALKTKFEGVGAKVEVR